MARDRGAEGTIIGIDHYGASADADVLYRKYGFTVERIVSDALLLVPIAADFE